jgi:hypothetical protein
MTQYMRPDGDLDSVWSCSTGTSRYALIDEETANDADYISTSTKSAIQTVSLSNPAETPASGGPVIVYIRAKGSVSGVKVYPQLKQGSSTMILDGSSSQATLTTSYANYSFAVASDNLQYITDWTTLQIGIRDGTVTGTCYVSQVWLVVPDPSIAAGLEMGMMF